MKKYVRINKLLLLALPISACNLRCEYCYITKQKLWNNNELMINKPVDEIVKSFHPSRIGGYAIINICGTGETLIPKESIEIIEGLAKLGHYIEIVTNGTLSKQVEKLCNCSQAVRSHLCFKFSFHYLELKKRNLIDNFFKNVWKVHNSGCSFTVEMVPYDKLDKYKNEIKNCCKKYLGNYCHLTIARDDTSTDTPILSKKSLAEYYEFWKDFNSEMFDFKYKLYGEKRKEFCYAGYLSKYIHLGTGDACKCYQSPIESNLFLNDTKYFPIAKCSCDHCYNGHAHLALGLIPSIKTPKYCNIRNIKLKDGTNSLTDEFFEIYGQKISNNSKLFSKLKEKIILITKTNKH